MKRLILSVLALIFAVNLALSPAALAEDERRVMHLDWFEYVVRADSTAEIVNYSRTFGEVVIPEILDGHRVVAISGDQIYRTMWSKVTIPDTVTEIIGNPFKYTSIKEIIVSPDHPTLEVIDGVLYGKQDHRLICCPAPAAIGLYEIRPGTEVIESFAFASCRELTGVTIPDSVTAIGDRAFSGCAALTDIRLPDSVTEVGTNPFTDCDALKEISVSADHPALSVVDGALFDKAGRLICLPADVGADHYTVPAGTESIGAWAFYKCRALKEVTLPDSVSQIGECAFSETGLVSIALPACLTVIETGTFESCTNLETVCIPDQVTEIGNGAFIECKSLTGVTIPDSVRRIGPYAFAICTALTEIDLPAGLSCVERGTFNGCEGLTRVGLPEGLTEIGDESFTFCVSLQTITIPDSVTRIEYAAFASCDSLQTITIPDSVTRIGYEAFAGCESLTSAEIPASVTEIGDDAFANNCLVSITVVKGSYAESWCEEQGLPYMVAEPQARNSLTGTAF